MTALIIFAIVYFSILAAGVLIYVAIGTFAYLLGLEKSWFTAMKKVFRNW